MTSPAAQAVINDLVARGCTLPTVMPSKLSSNTMLTITCSPCGTERTKLIKELTACRACNAWRVSHHPVDDTVLNDFLNKEGGPKNDELWGRVVGGWISTLGRALSALGELRHMDERGRFRMNGKQQDLSVLLLEAFPDKIKVNESVNLLSEDDRNTKKVRIALVDKSKPMTLDNVEVNTSSNIHAQGNPDARSSNRFFYTQSLSLRHDDRLKKWRYCKVPELPDHIIFEDGEVYNDKPGLGGKRYLAFSSSGSVRVDGKCRKSYYFFTTNGVTYFVNRLVCYAFSPLPGKTSYADYKDLQVNHKDCDTLNNHIINLEWTTQSENMLHAYQTGANSKVQPVLQFGFKKDGNKGVLIKEHMSIAQASRDTGVAEHVIRETANGKRKTLGEFFWEFKDQEKAAEYSKRYRSVA